MSCADRRTKTWTLNRRKPPRGALQAGLRFAGLAAGILALTVVAAPQALAGSKASRVGGQIDTVLGVTSCIPGRGNCSPGASKTAGPLFGFGVNLGYRIHKHFFLGSGYSLGFFGPSGGSGALYRRAFQNSVLAVIRGYLPAGDFDFGFEASPGWSRVSFKPSSGQWTSYSEGFAFRPGVSAAYWISSSIFLGLRVDTVINFHRKTCRKGAGKILCDLGEPGAKSRVSTVMAGVHIGGSF